MKDAEKADNIGELSFSEQAELILEGFKKGYKYDGCTAVPDFNFGQDCCAEHDYHYQDVNITRAAADRRLRECIQRKGYIILPWIYWLGVRLFGWRFWKRKQNETIDSATGVS